MRHDDLATADAPEPGDLTTDPHRLAATVLADMKHCGIAPTPRNYELWYIYHSGTDPDLTQRIVQLLDLHEKLTPPVLEALYTRCVGGMQLDVDAIASRADAIQEAAQVLVDQVTSGQVAYRDYGDALAQCSRELGDNPTTGGLVSAITALTAETTRAAERNRVLEQQLTASTARIAGLRKSLADVKQEATTDALTGIANRRAFETKLRRAISQSKADGSALSMLLIDIDHFKAFNDAHGHRAGDLVLRLVGRLLSDNVKGRDCAARYGGEEFAVLLTRAEQPAALIVAQQVCDLLASQRLTSRGYSNGLGHLTVSVGVAEYRGNETPAVFIGRADAALYNAKRGGRNRVCADTTA